MYYGSPDWILKCFPEQFVWFANKMLIKSFLKKSFLPEFFNLKAWHRNKDWSWNIYFLQTKWKGISFLCKCSLNPLKKFDFSFHVCQNCENYFNVAHTLCWPNGPFQQPAIPLGCSLDGWFDLIVFAVHTVILVGTVKGIRFILLYFYIFLLRFTFSYLLFSLDVVRP